MKLPILTVAALALTLTCALAFAQDPPKEPEKPAKPTKPVVDMNLKRIGSKDVTLTKDGLLQVEVLKMPAVNVGVTPTGTQKVSIEHNVFSGINLTDDIEKIDIYFNGVTVPVSITLASRQASHHVLLMSGCWSGRTCLSVRRMRIKRGCL